MRRVLSIHLIVNGVGLHVTGICFTLVKLMSIKLSEAAKPTKAENCIVNIVR